MKYSTEFACKIINGLDNHTLKICDSIASFIEDFSVLKNPSHDHNDMVIDLCRLDYTLLCDLYSAINEIVFEHTGGEI